MDRHHDMDDLAAHGHEIQVYRPESRVKTESDNSDIEEVYSNGHPDRANTYPKPKEHPSNIGSHLSPQEMLLGKAQAPSTTQQLRQVSGFEAAKGSLTGAIEPTIQAFDNFISNQKCGRNEGGSRFDSERSSANFGDGSLEKGAEFVQTFQKNSAARRDEDRVASPLSAGQSVGVGGSRPTSSQVEA